MPLQTLTTRSNNYGGIPDLYQNVTSSSVNDAAVLPTYEEVQRQSTSTQPQLYPHV